MTQLRHLGLLSVAVSESRSLRSTKVDQSSVTVSNKQVLGLQNPMYSTSTKVSKYDLVLA